jgi:hypothetical protein
MSVYVDKKFVSLLSPKLKNFKQRGEFLWNFSCPVCGDSLKNKTKARGYIYKKKEHFFFMCHNCHTSTTFQKFLKMEDPMLYREYILESFVQSNTSNSVNVQDFVTKPEFDITKVPMDILYSNAVKIDRLSPNHPARKYLEDRKVPFDGLSYTCDFATFVKNLFPDYSKTLYKEPRIIIPFKDNNGNLLGIQGRAIVKDSKIKYITIKVNEDAPKIFGWNVVDTSQTMYVVEGPIDSLFLRNCLATMDAALYTAPRVVGIDKDYIFVYDNEPRNKQIVSNIRKTIDLGYKVCIWPDTIKEKDINEMVLAGTSPAAIQHIIDNNTYEGLIATMKMNQWSKL